MRRLHAMPGGIELPPCKDVSLQLPIARAPLPPRLLLPLTHYRGSLARAVVTAGETVLKGQLLALPQHEHASSVHAPTSGLVSVIDGACPAIVLCPDGEDRWGPREALADYRAQGREAVLARIRAAGIAGMGGAGFPGALKLQPRPGTPVQTLIINGCECEPWISADEALMRERAPQIIAGARIMAWLLDASETVIAIEDDKAEAIAAMRAALAPAMEIAEIPARYPVGAERQLITILTGTELPSGSLPRDIGICCHNVATAAAVQRAVELGEPLIERIVTLTGSALQQPRNYEVALGTPIGFLLQLAGMRQTPGLRLILGGPMMGTEVEDTQTPVRIGTNCILAATTGDLPPAAPEQACIRCGICADACPVSLLPQQLLWHAQAGDHAGLQRHHLQDCIECGACTRVCPSSIPLVQYYRTAKQTLATQLAQRERAALARERFEARQARLQREEREKEQRRLARESEVAQQAEAAARLSRLGQVEAAIARVKAKKLASAGPEREQVGAAIDRAREKALRRAAETPAPTPPAPVTHESLTRREATLATKLLRAGEKLAEAQTAGDEAMIELLQRAERDLQRRIADCRRALQELAIGEPR
jgi:Na+-translocating ferredoxin:NAD+ oxidoreductase subunit C